MGTYGLLHCEHVKKSGRQTRNDQVWRGVEDGLPAGVLVVGLGKPVERERFAVYTETHTLFEHERKIYPRSEVTACQSRTTRLCSKWIRPREIVSSLSLSLSLSLSHTHTHTHARTRALTHT